MRKLETIAKSIASNTIDLYITTGHDIWTLDASKIAFEVCGYINSKEFNTNDGRQMLEDYIGEQIIKKSSKK